MVVTSLAVSTYADEWWHFEAMPATGACPELLADSSWGVVTAPSGRPQREM